MDEFGNYLEDFNSSYDLLSISSIDKFEIEQEPFSTNQKSINFYPFSYESESPCDDNSNMIVNPTIEKNKFIVYIQKSLRGRKRKREKDANNYNIWSIHDKFMNDNILSKLQVHYFSFIIEYANAVIAKFGYEEFFIKIDSKYKKIVNKKNISFLKGINIGYILSLDISRRFKNKNKEHNRILYDKVIENPIIKDLFSENYLTLFKNIYYENKKQINFKNNDLNDIIMLTGKKIKTYDDLLAKIKSSYNNEESRKYIKKLNYCIIKYYLSEDKQKIV